MCTPGAHPVLETDITDPSQRLMQKPPVLGRRFGPRTTRIRRSVPTMAGHRARVAVPSFLPRIHCIRDVWDAWRVDVYGALLVLTSRRAALGSARGFERCRTRWLADPHE